MTSLSAKTAGYMFRTAMPNTPRETFIGADVTASNFVAAGIFRGTFPPSSLRSW